MPQNQNSPNDLAQDWLGFSEDRRASLLQKMSPEQKSTLRAALEERGGVNAEMAPALLKQRIAALAEQNKTPLPEVKRDQTIPQYLQSIFTERAGENQAAAQSLVNQAVGPESVNRNLFERIGAEHASVVPEVAAVLDKVGAGLMDPKAAVAMVASRISPTLAAGYFLFQGLKGAGQEGMSGGVFSRFPNPDNVQNFLLGLSTAAASGASIGDTLSSPKIKDLAHQTAQRMVGAGPLRTTGKMVRDIAEDNAKVAEARIKVENENRGISDDAFHEAGKRQIKYEQEVREQAAAHAKAKAEVESHNEQVQRVEAQRTKYKANLDEGSRELGESVKSLNDALREEGNQNYNAVREATAKDPGEPLTDTTKAVRHAEKNILKGSTENIKQFRELLRKEPEAEGIETSAGFAAPGDPLYQALVEQGAIDTGGTLSFDQLQGYSSEIGAKLSAGNLQGDVYQALKHVKETLDAQKAKIAERNGVGTQLKLADKFWADYQKIFYDKPSAVADTLSRVGKLDPEHYAHPFVKGKAAKTGIDALREIKTTQPATRSYIDQTVALANSMRDTQAALDGLPKTKALKPMPEEPKPILRPAPVEATYKETPTHQPAPTESDVRAAKKEAIRTKAASLEDIPAFHLGIIGAGNLVYVLSAFVKGGFGSALESSMLSAGADVGYIAGRMKMASVLTKPKVMEWLSKPRPEDFELIRKLPQAEQQQIRSGLQKFIKKENVRNVNPLVLSFITGGASQQKTPAQMKRELNEIRDRATPPPSSNPF